MTNAAMTVRITARNNSDARRMSGSRLAGLGTLRHNGGKVLVADVIAKDTAAATLDADDRVAAYEIREAT